MPPMAADVLSVTWESTALRLANKAPPAENDISGKLVVQQRVRRRPFDAGHPPNHFSFTSSVSVLHFVRVGLLAQVGRFRSIDATRYPRGSRVIVRTVRGLEIGEVLGAADAMSDEAWSDAADGAILRRMTVEDQLLEERLERHRHEAFEACRRLLDEAGVAAALVDVEHLFDGRGLYFYFLGQPPPEVDRLTARLTEVYDGSIHFRRFAELLTAGCGPGCGTEDAEGGGCASCAAGCAVADACRTR